MTYPRRNSGFTLVELLVVIAIVGVLIALLLPAVQAAREASRRTQCQNNLRQLGIGLANYESSFRKLPAGKKWSGPPSHPSTFDVAWSALMLPQLEQQPIYDQINFRVPLTDPINLPATSQTISIFFCPSTSRIHPNRTETGHLYNLGGIPGEGLACMDYLAFSGPDKDLKHPLSGELYGRQRGVLIGTKGLPGEEEMIEPPPVTYAKITDGLSHTIAITESTGRAVNAKSDGSFGAIHGAWASGTNVTHIDKGINDVELPKGWHDERIISDHPRGANVLLCDSSVHFMSNDTDKKLIRWMASRDGQEPMPEDAPF